MRNRLIQVAIDTALLAALTALLFTLPSIVEHFA